MEHALLLLRHMHFLGTPHCSGTVSTAVHGIRAANASLATTVEGLLQPTVPADAPARAKVVSARAFNESKTKEQARVARLREAGTEDEAKEQMVVALEGSANQPCDAVCAKQDLSVRCARARVCGHAPQ